MGLLEADDNQDLFCCLSIEEDNSLEEAVVQDVTVRKTTQEFDAMADNVCLASNRKLTYLMDSGASNHLTNQRDTLFNYRECKVQVTFANNGGYVQKVSATCTSR